MEENPSERRKEPRFRVDAGASFEVNKNGQILRATTLDMSGSGVLLRFDGAVQLAPGDEVTCDFKLSSDADNSLPHWGIGTVVRVDGRSVAIELKAGGLCELEPKAEVPTVRESVPRA
jgi:hypothetical protein